MLTAINIFEVVLNLEQHVKSIVHEYGNHSWYRRSGLVVTDAISQERFYSSASVSFKHQPTFCFFLEVVYKDFRSMFYGKKIFRRSTSKVHIRLIFYLQFLCNYLYVLVAVFERMFQKSFFSVLSSKPN